MRFSVDRTWRRPNAGDVVIAGSPIRAFRLTSAGRQVVDAIESGNDVPASAFNLVDRLVDAGAIHPLPDPSLPAPDPRTITAVIPAFVCDADSASRLSRLVAALDGLAVVVVVDDASPAPLPTLAAGTTPVEVIRRATNGGPGAARNSGLERTATPRVLFVDADVECRIDEIMALATWLAASNASAIAPRVRTTDGGSALATYENARSPLDMGDRPARVRGGTRVSYVPAAVLLCDTDAVRSIGGFDESMRTGEDVDLVWRMDAAGLRCRFEPAVEVLHTPRSSLPALVRQRIGYGESTTTLRRRHGEKVAPVRASWPTVGSWLALAVGLPLVACVTAAFSGVLLARKLRFVPGYVVESARLTAKTHLHVGRNLAAAVTRVWWPIALVIALFSRRARLALCAAALVPAAADWWEKRPRLDPIRFTLMRILDDAAYGVGVWTAVIRERDPAALAPSIHGPTTQNG